MIHGLTFFGSRSTSNDFHQFASDDGLTGTVEENLKFSNHVSGIFGGILVDSILASSSLSADRLDEYLRPWHCGEPTVRKRDLRRGPEHMISRVYIESGLSSLNLPRKANWPGRTRGDWRVLRRRFQKQRSWLIECQ